MRTHKYVITPSRSRSLSPAASLPSLPLPPHPLSRCLPTLSPAASLSSLPLPPYPLSCCLPTCSINRERLHRGHWLRHGEGTNEHGAHADTETRWKDALRDHRPRGRTGQRANHPGAGPAGALPTLIADTTLLGVFFIRTLCYCTRACLPGNPFRPKTRGRLGCMNIAKPCPGTTPSLLHAFSRLVNRCSSM
jgi:hypothetical protein